MPKFRNNIDLQSNQLVNGVLHNLKSAPVSPVNGMIYYDTSEKRAFIFNEGKWAYASLDPAEFDAAGTGHTEATAHVLAHETAYNHTTFRQDIRQFTFHMSSPAAATGFHITRLFENFTVLRIDSHVNSGTSVAFDIEHRSSVNATGTKLTASPIVAVNLATATTTFSNSLLTANNWLYVNITGVSGTVGYFWLTITCSIRV
ncbi:MAG: hypothetical protein WCI71_10270 [Bacteroidota bacterium]